ncbi:MAG: hypothetical protein OEZ15_07455 [Gammaproteobacteria bacterium]|nr:hypothetical protein [Gammaproteobacteria bacterium]
MQDNNEIIIENFVAGISADNYDDFDQELDPAKLGQKLVQNNPLRGSVGEYQIYADRHMLLNLVKSKKARPKKYRVSLSYLLAEPEHYKMIAWKWLYACLSLLALTALFVTLVIKDMMPLAYGVTAAAVTFTAAVICALIFVYLMRDEYIFKGEFGGIELFRLENKKPNQKVCDEFLIVLQNAIDKSKANISVANRLVNELKMCRRLKDENIIDEDAYTAARTAIFRHKQYKA